MLAWFYHLRQKECKSLVAASLASLTKIYGVLLVVAIGYDYLRRRQFNKIPGLIIPILLVVGWNLFSLAQTGTIAVLAARIFWQSKNAELFRQSLLGTLHGDVNSISIMLGFGLRYLPIAVAASSTVLLALFLCYKVWKLDVALALYAISSILAVFFNFFPGFGSFPRYLFFLFPIGLTLYVGKRWLWTILLIALIIMSYWGWWAFLADGFF
jgi:predicted neutral ceramidase superfamily lipid hydrolase